MVPVTACNVLRHEIIGLEATARGEKNSIKINGTIIDETRNTILFDQHGESKRVAKGDASFVFNLGGTLVEVEGWALIGRPEDRIKKKTRRNW